MKQYRMNPDRKYVDIIINGIMKKEGHCPCRVNVDETTLCPCDEFIATGICKCKLFIPLEEVKVEESK
ncbi:MAG: ferredoxin thioredoxin reductase catalytic beta chain [Bacilli bacterium]|nr:ferredoxin thioredoxin reductase catalytic beta chain [Bacilli bacterium]